MSASDATGQRSTRTRIALGGLALLGIGAAITTAAWTDNVWLQAEANAASFNLQGSLSATGDWGEYAAEGEALRIPIDTSQFRGILPNTEVSTEVYVRNDSSVPATISVDTIPTGALFAADSTVTAAAAAETSTLAPGEHTKVTITLTAGEMPAEFQEAAGSVTVHVTGAP